MALQRAVADGVPNWQRFAGKPQVAEALERLQQGLCAYCLIRVDSGIGSHIEHVWPKSSYIEKTFQWDNLVLSCTHSDHIGHASQTGGVSCGHSDGKRDWPAYDPRFISPGEPDCERYFEYRAGDGTVRPAAGLSEPDKVRADYTIGLLNLNCGRLCRLRKDMIEMGYGIIASLRDDETALAHFLDSEFAEVGGRARSFITARRQHFGAFA